MADQEVKIRIITDASGAVTGFKTVRDEVDKTEKHSGGLVSKIKTHWLGLTAAAASVGAAWMTVSKAMDFIKLGADAQQAEESFKRVGASAGYTSEQMDEYSAAMKKASAGTVDDSDAMQKAVKGMALGLKPDEIVKIMEAARRGARLTGEDVQSAYEKITDSIATGMPKALKRYGLATTEEVAIIKAAVKAGVEDVNLLKIALVNAAIQAEKMGNLSVTNAEKIQIFNAKINDAKEQLGIMALTIAENILPAMGLLDKELAKDSGATWGKRFVLAIIPIQAEIMRLAMLLDKLGGTATSAQMLLYGPGAALGYKPSVKRFEGAAEANINYEKRYQETDKALEELAKKEIALQAELSGNGAKQTGGGADKGSQERIKQLEAERKALEDSIKAQTAAKTNQAAAEKAAETLKEKWLDTERTLNSGMAANGLDDLGKKLEENKLKAEKLKDEFKALPTALRETAYAKIDQFQAGEDKKARYDDAIELMKKEIDLGVEATKNGIDRIKERGDAARDLYRDMKGYEQEYYNESLKLIDDQVGRFRAAALDEIAIEKWKEEQKRLAGLQLKRSVPGAGTFDEGWSEGVKDWGKDVNNMFVQGEKLAKTTATAMSSSFSDFFFDAIRGECKSFQDYFKSFSDSILKAFSDMLADMVAKWIMETAKMAIGSAGSSLWNIGLSAIGSFGGAIGSGAGTGVVSGSTPAQVEAAGGIVAHSGGLVGYDSFPSRMIPAYAFAGAPRFHKGFAPDEFPAILQRGERVLSRKQVATGGGSNLTVNVPISADVGSKKMIADLRDGIESTVVSILRKHS